MLNIKQSPTNEKEHSRRKIIGNPLDKGIRDLHRHFGKNKIEINIWNVQFH